MKANYLLPANLKNIGWVLLILSAVLGIPTLIMEWSPGVFDLKVFAIFIDAFSGNEKLFGFIENNILNEILGLSAIIGGLTVAFSRELDEDEFISKMRLECLAWAIYWNYGILVVAFLLVYDFSFYWVMVFNMFTPLVLFIVRFNWLTMRMRKSLRDEE